MMNPTERRPREERRTALLFLFVLAAYFTAQTLLRAFSGDALGNDEAEQVFIATGFRLGYYMDPPLYNWLQVVFFRALGSNLWALAVLNNGVLFFFYAFFFLAARVYFESARLGAVAALSLFFVPEIAWESQRDETHTIMAMAVGAATLYVLIRLVRERATWCYAALGIVLGLGFLSKYNYVCFAAAAAVAALVRADSRRAVLDRRIALTFLAGLAVALPHALWWLAHRPGLLHASETGKLDAYHRHALFSLAANTFKLIAPAALVALWFAPRGLLKRLRGGPSACKVFDAGAYLVAATAIVAVLVIAMNIWGIQQHWLAPTLFAAPLYFLGGVRPDEVAGRRWRGFAVVAGAILVTIPLGLVVYRSGLGASRLGLAHYPFGMLAKRLEERRLDRAILITDKLQMAGNLRYRFPDAVVAVAGIDENDLAKAQAGQALVVVWQPVRKQEPPPVLAGFIRGEIDPALAGVPFETVYLPAYGRTGNAPMSAGLVVDPAISPAVAARLAARAAGPSGSAGAIAH